MHSTDAFLGGRIKLKQKINGLRATSDSVLVAAAVQAKANETILDVGAGNGVIGLCISARVPIKLTALEIQEDLVSLIQENALLNDKKITVIRNDIFQFRMKAASRPAKVSSWIRARRRCPANR